MKTAKQWQEDLGLEDLPDAELLALLNEAAGAETAAFTADEALTSGRASDLHLHHRPRLVQPLKPQHL